MTTTPRDRAMQLQGQIAADRDQENRLDQTIGSLTEARYAVSQRRLEAEAELRSLQARHYADLVREVQVS